MTDSAEPVAATARDSETTVPWFQQREFISDSDSDEDN